MQCTNQPPDIGGGLYQPVAVLYADKPYVIATQQDGTHPTAFGAVGTGHSVAHYMTAQPQNCCAHGAYVKTPLLLA